MTSKDMKSNDPLIPGQTEENPICMLRARNYKVNCLIGRRKDMLISKIAVLDSGSGPNLVHARAVPGRWREYVKPIQGPYLVDAQRKRITTLGSLRMIVRLGQFKALVDFIVVQNMAVDLILGTSFIDKHVKAIYPRYRKVTFYNDPPVSIIGVGKPPLGKTDEPEEKPHPFATNTVSNKIRLARGVSIPPMTQVETLVQTDKDGLLMIQNHPKMIHKHLTLAANGVADVIRNKPFRIVLSNFGETSVTLAKNTVVALAMDAPLAVMTIQNGTTLDEKKTETTDKNWREDVQIGLEDDESRQKVLDLLEDFDDMWSGDLGTISVTKHRIDLEEDSRPVFQQPYRSGLKARQFERDEVNRMLAAKVIEPSSSEWASPVVIVAKKDGTFRFCVDYRKLNAVTLRDSYPLPRMDEYIDSLGEATVFTTLDCNSGYWQIEMDERDRDKTTFTSHAGLYRFMRMPFGLKNAPATFQRAVDIILSRVKWQCALVYIDDVIVYSRTIEEHFSHVREVLTLLRQSGITLKLRKCAFFESSVEYLGHVIRPGRLEVANANIESIKKAKIPTTQTELRSFIGMCNVYRRFVPNFARIAAPLNKRLKKGEPTQLGPLSEEELESYETLKTNLVTAPILALPREGYRFTLDTDACDYQVGCVLLQEQPNGDKHPIGYWSRGLNSAEKNYSTTEKECLAIVWSILTLRPYLHGVQFTIRTDHEPLKWLLNLMDASGRLARWRLRLAEYDFNVEYRPGRVNNLADGMSRLPTEGETKTSIDEEIPCFVVLETTLEETDPISPMGLAGLFYDPDDQFVECPEVLALVDNDAPADPIPIEEFLEEQSKDPFCKAKAETVGEANSNFDYDRYGFLVRRSPLDGALQRVVPKSLQARVLHAAHYPRLAGHPGGTRMYLTLRRDYYWPHMANDAYATVKSCRSCNKNRGTAAKHQKLLKLFPASGPLEFVAMDLLGPLPKTKRGNTFVLVITDRYSKLTRAIPLKATKATDIAMAFLDTWVYVYGAPKFLLTDNGPQFVAKFFETICSMLGVRHFTTTAYHPQTNGQAERFNRTIVQRLRHYVAEHQTDWDLYIQPLTYAYNMQVHRTTGTTPFDLILSRHPPNIISGDVSTAVPDDLPDEDLSTAKLKKRILRDLQKGLEQAKTRMTKAQKRYKDDFDKNVHKTVTVQPGDYVFVDRPKRPLKGTDSSRDATYNPGLKLLPKSTGPFLVTKANADTVTIEEDGLQNTVSIDRVWKDESSTANPVRESEREVSADPEGPHGDELIEEDPEMGPDHYAVDKIVGHEEGPTGMLYKIRWYGYSPRDDTMEPEENIPTNFIRRYWQQKARMRRR